MSNVSNVHQFAPLTKDSKPLNGQRLVRLIAKKTKAGTYESENLAGSHCVSIPHIAEDDIVANIDKLLPHVVSMVKDTQDKIIREWRILHGRNEIPESEFDIASVIGWLDANATSDRFTTEYLQEWFMTEYADTAAAFIRRAIDGAADEIIAAKVSVLRDMFAGFAGARYSPAIPVCKAIIRFGDYCSENGVIDSRMDTFVGKTREILEKKEQELASDALGF